MVCLWHHYLQGQVMAFPPSCFSCEGLFITSWNVHYTLCYVVNFCGFFNHEIWVLSGNTIHKLKLNVTHKNTIHPWWTEQKTTIIDLRVPFRYSAVSKRLLWRQSGLCPAHHSFCSAITPLIHKYLLLHPLPLPSMQAQCTLSHQMGHTKTKWGKAFHFNQIPPLSPFDAILCKEFMILNTIKYMVASFLYILIIFQTIKGWFDSYFHQ